MQSPRTINLLHVEEDASERQRIAHHLSSLHDFSFSVQCVAGEQEAVQRVAYGGVEFVLLDHQLSAGSSLSCVRRLRQLDAVLPIVMLCGTATSEDALQIVEAGASDCLARPDLTDQALARCIRGALIRSEALRERQRAIGRQLSLPCVALLGELCTGFLAALPADFAGKLEAAGKALRQAELTGAQAKRIFEELSARLLEERKSLPVGILLRPLLLDILLRLDEEPAHPAVAVQPLAPDSGDPSYRIEEPRTAPQPCLSADEAGWQYA